MILKFIIIYAILLENIKLLKFFDEIFALKVLIPLHLHYQLRNNKDYFFTL